MKLNSFKMNEIDNVKKQCVLFQHLPFLMELAWNYPYECMHLFETYKVRKAYEQTYNFFNIALSGKRFSTKRYITTRLCKDWDVMKRVLKDTPEIENELYLTEILENGFTDILDKKRNDLDFEDVTFHAVYYDKMDIIRWLDNEELLVYNIDTFSYAFENGQIEILDMFLKNDPLSVRNQPDYFQLVVAMEKNLTSSINWWKENNITAQNTEFPFPHEFVDCNTICRWNEFFND